MDNKEDKFASSRQSVYFFKPVFEQKPVMPDMAVFLSAMNRRFGQVTTLKEFAYMPENPQDLTSFILWDHQVYYEKDEREVPSQLVLYGPDEFDQDQFDRLTIANFWKCPDKEGFLSKCNYSIMASNMLAAGLPFEQQYGILAEYADLILEMFPDCIGIYWPHSQNLVPREKYLKTSWNAKNLHFLDGGLNVRFFTLTGSDEMLFDTMGFAALGLPDLQLHCKEIEPDDAVRFLRNLAAYLYHYGDVIEDGNTVEGIDGEKWKCRHEEALAGPARVVLDIHAGELAGGDR